MPKIMYKNVPYGNAPIQKLEMTQAEYDALSQADKMKDILYLITDGQSVRNVTADEVSYGDSNVEDELDRLNSVLSPFRASKIVWSHGSQSSAIRFSGSNGYIALGGLLLFIGNIIFFNGFIENYHVASGQTLGRITASLSGLSGIGIPFDHSKWDWDEDWLNSIPTDSEGKSISGKEPIGYICGENICDYIAPSSGLCLEMHSMSDDPSDARVSFYGVVAPVSNSNS